MFLEIFLGKQVRVVDIIEEYFKKYHEHSDFLQHHKATKYSKITVFWPVGPRKGK